MVGLFRLSFPPALLLLLTLFFFTHNVDRVLMDIAISWLQALHTRCKHSLNELDERATSADTASADTASSELPATATAGGEVEMSPAV
jgi:hypothetical protein